MSGFRHAFSLPQSEVKAALPPGTVRLVEISHRDEVCLVPKPSADPADPLNWPKWRKSAVLLCMAVYAFIGNFTSASISSAFPLLATPLAFNPPVSFGKLSRLVAVNVLMQGAASLWWVPLANTFGRRPILLLNLLILTLSSMWAGLTNDFNSLIAARFFMGVGNAPADTISPDVVGEIYFTHQRGRAIGIYTVFLAMGSIVGALSGGYIAGNMGLKWLHWINVILAGITLVLTFLLAPETLFDRDEAMQLHPVTSVEAELGDKQPSTSQVENTSSVSTHSFRPFTFARSLRIGTYRPGLLQKLIAPYLTLRLPGVWLVMLWYAGLVAGIVTLSVVGPSIVAAPPYLWGSSAGLINVGGIIGTFLGVVITAFLADRAVTAKAKVESLGLAEAEDRLPVAIPGLIIATAGIWTFGFCAQYPGPKMWIGMEFGYGMLAFGLLQAPSIGFNYLIDAYNAVSGDCFVMVTCMRAIISFAWTFFVGDWVASAGPQVPFGVFGGMLGLFSILIIPQWYWGKRTRIATAKWMPAQVDH